MIRGGEDVINVSRGRTDLVKPSMGLGCAGTFCICVEEGSPLGEVATADQNAAADVTTPPLPPLAERTSYLDPIGFGHSTLLGGC